MKKHFIIKQFFLSFLCLLCIPLFSSIIIYIYSSRMIIEDTKKSNSLFIEDNIELIEKEFVNLDYMVKRLVTNNDINSFLNTQNLNSASPLFSKVIDAANIVHSYRINNDFLTDFFIYSRFNDIIISTKRVHTVIENDYNFFFQYDNYNFTTWKSVILNSYYFYEFLPATTICFEDKEYRVLPFVQSIPFKNKKHFRGNVVAYINGVELDKLLQRLNRKNKGYVYILNKKNEIVYDIGKPDIVTTPVINLVPGVHEIKLGGKKWIASLAKSQLTGLKIVSLLPYSFIEEKSKPIKYNTIVVTFALISIGLFISIFLAYWNSKPVKEISEIARKQSLTFSDKKNDFENIKENLIQLISKNNNLAEYKKIQMPIVTNLILIRLLKGNKNIFENIDTVFKYNDIDLKSPPYNVALFNIRGFGGLINEDIYHEIKTLNFILKKEIEEFSKIKGYVLILEENKIAWIYQENKRIDLKCFFYNLCVSFKESYSVDLYVSRGSSKGCIKEIPEAYQEAYRTMEYIITIDNKSHVCYFNEIPERNDTFFYNLDLETKLILSVKEGDIDNVNIILDEVYEENFLNRSLSSQMIHYLIDALSNTMIRIKNYYMDDEIILSDYSDIVSVKVRFAEIKKKFISLAGKIDKIKNSESELLSKKIINFIDKNYSDPLLTLYMLSEEIEYKETYLYHFFNDYFKKSFSAYLEYVRMEKACEFLNEKTFSIGEISEKVGYSSAHSFRRAFKRYYNYSPSQYVKSI